MADWKKIAEDAKKAVKEVDKAISQLEKKTINALDTAIADGEVTEEEKTRIAALGKQTKQLINARTRIVDAGIDALDKSPDLVRIRRRFRDIRQSLADREEELEQEEQVAKSIGKALGIMVRILGLLLL